MSKEIHREYANPKSFAYSDCIKKKPYIFITSKYASYTPRASHQQLLFLLKKSWTKIIKSSTIFGKDTYCHITLEVVSTKQ